jgi:hypothetical protein
MYLILGIYTIVKIHFLEKRGFDFTVYDDFFDEMTGLTRDSKAACRKDTQHALIIEVIDLV